MEDAKSIRQKMTPVMMFPIEAFGWIVLGYVAAVIHMCTVIASVGWLFLGYDFYNSWLGTIPYSLVFYQLMVAPHLSRTIFIAYSMFVYPSTKIDWNWVTRTEPEPM